MKIVGVYIHPTAVVDTDQIGQGTRIWAFSHIMKDVSVGADCNIGEHCFIESGAFIGNEVTVKNGTMVWEGITLEDGVFVGPHVSFTNDLYPRSPRLLQARERYNTKQWLLPTVVKAGATVGASAVLLANLTIGEFSMVGAGAVVTKDVPSYALVAGNPARLRGWVCQCGQPLKFQQNTSACCDCGRSFVKDDMAIRLVKKP